MGDASPKTGCRQADARPRLVHWTFSKRRARAHGDLTGIRFKKNLSSSFVGRSKCDQALFDFSAVAISSPSSNSRVVRISEEAFGRTKSFGMRDRIRDKFVEQRHLKISSVDQLVPRQILCDKIRARSLVLDKS
jgi:hypothetical protein